MFHFIFLCRFVRWGLTHSGLDVRGVVVATEAVRGVRLDKAEGGFRLLGGVGGRERSIWIGSWKELWGDCTTLVTFSRPACGIWDGLKDYGAIGLIGDQGKGKIWEEWLGRVVGKSKERKPNR